MSEKKVVCHGALCTCQFGDTPDTLTVQTQQKTYVNDAEGAQKLVATDKELGTPFKKKTFGQCKKQPTLGGFAPCVPNITDWKGANKANQLKNNGGQPLLEDSKATCAMAGTPCVEITFHGQVAEPTSQNLKNADEEVVQQMLPALNLNEIERPSPNDAVEVSPL